MDVPSPVLPAAEMSDGRCVRRRLQSKSRPVWDSLSDGGAARGGLWSEFQEGEFGGLDSRQQYKKVYNKFFKWVSSNPQVQNTSESSCCRALLQLAVVDLSSLVKKQKSRLLVFFVEYTSAPAFVKSFTYHQWDPEKVIRPRLVLDSTAVLLTYQGDWGLIALSPGKLQGYSEDQITEYVEKLSCVVEICNRFQLHSNALADRCHVSSWACGVEICFRTWEEKGQLRLHGHLFMRGDRSRVRCEDQLALSFMSVLPHLRDTLWGKTTARCCWAGAYYTLAPKIGAIHRGGPLKPNHDFPVNPDWIFGMIESSKMSYRSARSELIACGKACARRLNDLDCWHRNKQEALISARVEAVQKAMRSLLKPFPSWPIVDQWLYQVNRPCQSRKTCLVLYGPSRVGKTEFVRSLFHVGSVLELNCAGLSSICLHGFNCQLHKCLLWDEASPKLVADNRKVFQHPVCKVDLGHSPTGQHVVNYFLNDCCSVITSNSWHEDAARLPLADQAWLAANMVIFNVSQPLWQECAPV